MIVSAPDVMELLAAKHAEDVFVPQCKGGPTQLQRTRLKILDAWAMPKSWARWTTIGYEVKISRADFLRDQKWPGYLDLCHEFNFVAPEGVITLDDLPAECGLLLVSKTGRRLFTKKKAPRREIEFPKDLFIYVLMSRITVKGEWSGEREQSKTEHWRAWLAKRAEEQSIGYSVSKRLSELADELRKRVHSAELAAKADEELNKLLLELGLDRETMSDWQIKQFLRDRLGGAEQLRKRLDYHLGSMSKILGGSTED